MTKRRQKPTSRRRYPPFFEKAVPIALAVIVIAVIVLLVISIVVALNLVSGTG